MFRGFGNVIFLVRPGLIDSDVPDYLGVFDSDEALIERSGRAFIFPFLLGGGSGASYGLRMGELPRSPEVGSKTLSGLSSAGSVVRS